MKMATRRTAVKAAPVVDEIEDLELDEVEDDEEAPAPKRRAPARKPAARRAAVKKAPEPVEDDEDDEEEEVEEAPAPKRRGRPAAVKPSATAEKPRAAAKRPEVEFGTAALVEHVNAVCGTEYKAYDLRVILRKMAKNGELDREVGADRSRYSFTGPKDAAVVALVKKVKGGAVEATKKEALDKLKNSTAAKATAGPAKKRGRPAKKAAPVEEDELEFDDDEEIDELD